MKKKKKKANKRAGTNPILAAGGIVTRGRSRPVFAVVRLRRQKSWVLPKGKLNRDETALAAAKREAIEETGHDMTVCEFLGTLAYTTSGRPKIVRFWRMEASGKPVAKLMKDVSAVRWLPLARAIAKLTHEREQEFLAKVGPHALSHLRRNHAPPRPTVRGKQTPRRAKRRISYGNGKAAAMERPLPHTHGAPAFVERPVRRPAQLVRAKLGSASAAPREIMQALWRWLGR
jgi:8-oxo-dGTP diphosphatase